MNKMAESAHRENLLSAIRASGRKPQLDVWDFSYFKGAINTLKASRWETFKARWLGQRYETCTEGHRVVGYHYHGKFYLTDYAAPHTS